MPQSAPTSPLDSRYTPSDEVRFDMHIGGGEYLSPFEHHTEDREVAEALQRALAAFGNNVFETATPDDDVAPARVAEVSPEVRTTSIEELHKVGGMIRYARDYELAA